MFLALFWAYIGQPDDHKGWAPLMPFNQFIVRTNSWKNRGGYFCIRHFDFFCFIPVNIYNLARMGQSFADYSGLLQKSRCAHISVTQYMSVGTVYNEVKIVLKKHFYRLIFSRKFSSCIEIFVRLFNTESSNKMAWKFHKNSHAHAEIFGPII